MIFMTNPVIFRTNPVIFRTKPVIFRTYQVIFRTIPVILWKNPVKFRTNPVKFRKFIFYMSNIRSDPLDLKSPSTQLKSFKGDKQTSRHMDIATYRSKTEST